MIGPGRPSVVAVGGLGRVAAGTGVCRSGAGHLVVELLRALRGSSQKLAAALDGHTLAVEVVVLGIGGGRFLLLLSPDGGVYRLAEDAWHGGPGAFRPHVTLRGRPRDLLAVLFGERETSDAAFAGTVTFHVDRTDELLPHYPRVVQLVAEELARLLRR